MDGRFNISKPMGLIIVQQAHNDELKQNAVKIFINVDKK